MSNIIIACPYCKTLNRLPKKNSYKKAICGICKGNLLENKPISLNNSYEFEKIINKVNVPIIIYFWPHRHRIHQKLSEIFVKVAKNFSIKVQFIKINTDINQQIAKTFDIKSIPTIVAIKDRMEVNRARGIFDEFNFKIWVDKIVN